MDRAEGIYIWAQDGRRWIDGSSGAMVVNIGHGNRNVLDAMKRQMERTTFAYRLHFENDAAEDLATRLCDLMPPGFDRVFFVSGGSEATESCIKLARQYAVATGQAGRYKVISRFPSYHGCTLGALAVTGYAALAAPFSPLMAAMPKIPAPTAYLDRDDLTPAGRGLRYADMLEAAIKAEGPETVLAFIMEPVGGASTGALVAPDSYYPRVREICDRYGVLLIHDEVMSGAGRTGKFLAGDHWPDGRPDLVALSKGLGSGYCPLGAMVAPDRIVAPVLAAGGFLHGFTYAGNPLASAAGLAVLDEMERGDMIGNAARMGAVLAARLEGLKARFPFIGDVRGKGLLLAAELVADPGTMEPLPARLNAYQRLVDIAYDKGLIIYSRRTRGGYEGDHVLVCPPLIITEAQVEELMAILTESLADLAAELHLPVGA
ncbi:aspartate aminotransferase family protein [Zavarzinia compransoris]|uniref:aminotransferase family protein n=1 Tax=Zavarzinia compransoris TaxID=1264899 RepID=UPI0010D2131E|nr:aspartate aminotransferase family protein [Zavarzinia compransoris]TDP40414.1 adenosylmethionine-8-amino-7-oxononanoate aminotransferase [Zavarzinia compransoris]